MLHGATQVIFEGVPTYPTAARIWSIVDKYKVTACSEQSVSDFAAGFNFKSGLTDNAQLAALSEHHDVPVHCTV